MHLYQIRDAAKPNRDEQVNDQKKGENTGRGKPSGRNGHQSAGGHSVEYSLPSKEGTGNEKNLPLKQPTEKKSSGEEAPDAIL